MDYEHILESVGFRTREEQIARICKLFHFPEADALNVTAASVIRRNILEAEARGAAAEEKRRKDAEWERPVCFTEQDELDRVKKGESGYIYSSPRPEGIYEDYWPIPLFTRPANVAELEARVKELEAEKHTNEVAAFERGFQGGRRDRYKQYERDTAEAGAAERERCAKVCEQQRETFADPSYAGGPIGAFSEMFACKRCAAAIRKGSKAGEG